MQVAAVEDHTAALVLAETEGEEQEEKEPPQQVTAKMEP
jgi:hypothetical protein